MKLLAVIDMQNDFIDGALGTAEAVQIVGRVAEKISSIRESGAEVVFTRDTHGEDYLSTSEGKKLPVEHCVRGTYGWEITDKLEVRDSKIIDKPTFGSYELAEYAASIEKLEEVILVGLCTDICVISNAMLLKARLPEVRITVDSGCCAGVTPQSHENALEAMKMCQIDVE
ncbi:MAG: cysteine hydrolase [Ruminococcus sp.]|nr:cysteine hydrolase [Ruminococcus sp.]MBQ8298038.1 cysteine hydrolase [Ruminococcus sp.]